LLKKLIFQESGFRQDIVSGDTKSPKGATGIAQFMPDTAKELGADPTDPKQAIPAAGKYLSSLKEQTGSWEGAVAAYNWGIGNLTRQGIENAPEETRNYLQAIVGSVGVASADQ
jgi:soluble lytic murein transglycosylase-like protein